MKVSREQRSTAKINLFHISVYHFWNYTCNFVFAFGMIFFIEMESANIWSINLDIEELTTRFPYAFKGKRCAFSIQKIFVHFIVKHQGWKKRTFKRMWWCFPWAVTKGGLWETNESMYPIIIFYLWILAFQWYI